jgi:hypothetical protein
VISNFTRRQIAHPSMLAKLIDASAYGRAEGIQTTSDQHSSLKCAEPASAGRFIEGGMRIARG